ncbi:zinc-binding dehydrogenase [Rhodococcus sp. USK13]|uniref:quinone oxidoreductase family protein n=1 Tax=Rhodococcus sp. USK13 TaxID=2806442 RepID=UPI001BCCFDB8|nr:zinc-binding dehydrogenase [Rhodococcus sp. USK13]
MGSTMRAVAYTGLDGPKDIQLIDEPVPTPAKGEVLIRVSRVGVNAADKILLDTGFNPFTGQPSTYLSGSVIPGGEVVGVREDTGQRVVALCGAGGYAEWVAVSETRVFPVPDHVDDADALTLMASGLTAWFLYEAAHIAPGESVVITGAAGALGSIAVQLGVCRGAGRVIALASTPKKRQFAQDLGAHAVTDSSADRLADRLVEANGGAPVDVVFDMVGGKVFEEARAALAPFGRIVVFGTASGDSPTLETVSLAFGSHSVTGVWLPNFVDAGLAGPALDTLFELHGRGEVRTQEGPLFDLEHAREAQDALADRNTFGKVQIDVTTR